MYLEEDIAAKYIKEFKLENNIKNMQLKQ